MNETATPDPSCRTCRWRSLPTSDEPCYTCVTNVYGNEHPEGSHPDLERWEPGEDADDDTSRAAKLTATVTHITTGEMPETITVDSFMILDKDGNVVQERTSLTMPQNVSRRK